MVASATDFLGIGMYTPAEAAMYARITPQTMSRWVHGDKRFEAAIRAQVPEADEKTITFLDFVQTLAVRAIREQKTVPLQKIRQAIDFCAERGIQYPFARSHRTYWWDGSIHLDVEGYGLLQVSGKQRGQLAMKPIVEMYLAELTFNSDGLAREYMAYEARQVKIVMRPEYRFGEPFVESCGHTAWTLWQACLSEGSAKAAAGAYGVTEDEAFVAFKYIDSIRPPTNAAA
ncbi:MAG TPA: hypothetical protein VH370_05675 [Humisphaera sp.]|jgi:hypothetical protein|nr:hypothetical protein [Humisphaera sp.]